MKGEKTKERNLGKEMLSYESIMYGKASA